MFTNSAQSKKIQAIAQHIDYVIGMSQAIGDRAAIEFAVGFYDALGAGKTFEEAYARIIIFSSIFSLPTTT